MLDFILRFNYGCLRKSIFDWNYPKAIMSMPQDDSLIVRSLRSLRPKLFQSSNFIFFRDSHNYDCRSRQFRFFTDFEISQKEADKLAKLTHNNALTNNICFAYQAYL